MPSEVILLQIETQEVGDTYGRFVAQPLEHGMGTTLGNALRRVLLSGLPGAAVTWVKIDGVSHEFSTIPQMKEDTIELLLNLKGLRLRPLVPGPGKLSLEVQGPGVVTAADIRPSQEFEVGNPDLYLATLDSSEGRLSLELNVEQSKGYLPAGQGEGLPLGALPVDAIFTPVKKVNYAVERVHAGRDASSDRLVLEVWTDATLSPLEALSRGAELLAELLGPFTALTREAQVAAPKKPRFALSAEQAATPVDKMDFSVRTINALKRGGINALGDLLERSPRELMELRQFGPKAMDEVRERLQALGFWEEAAEEGDTEKGDTGAEGDAGVATATGEAEEGDTEKGDTGAEGDAGVAAATGEGENEAQ